MVFSIFKNGKDFVTKRQDSILSAAVVMMVATVATKVLGLVKLLLLANLFGTSRQLDIFYAANTIPSIVFNLLVIGSLNTALIPILSEVISKHEKGKMVEVFNTVLSVACLILIIIGLIGIIFAGNVTYLMVHLNLSPQQHPFSLLELDQMTLMIRILFISPVILGVSFLVSGILIVYKRFIITQLASVLYTLGFIISIFVFTPIMGIQGLCWGVVLGSVLHLLVQLPVLNFLGIKIKINFNIKDIFVQRIGKLMLPRLLGLAGEQLGDFVDTVLALGLIPGSLTAFQYAYTYYIFPVSFIGWSFAQAAFPTLSEEFNHGRMDSFKANFVKSLQQILYFILPLTVIFIVLRLPLVRLLGIGKGTQFGWDGTIVTAWVLLFFGIDIISQSVLSLIIRAFYAMQDTKTPVKASVLGLILNVILSIYLVKVFGRFDVTKGFFQNVFNIHYYLSNATSTGWMAVGGLAAAGTISSLLSLAIMAVVINKQLGGFSVDLLWKPITKKLTATLIMAATMYGVYRTLDVLMNTSRTVELLFLIIITCYIGMSMYLFSTFMLQDEEIELVYRVAGKVKNILYGRKDLPTGIEQQLPVMEENA